MSRCHRTEHFRVVDKLSVREQISSQRERPQSSLILCSFASSVSMLTNVLAHHAFFFFRAPKYHQVVVALPSPQEKRPPQILESTGAVAPEMPPLMFPEGHPDESATPAESKLRTSDEPLNPDEAKPLMELAYDKLVYSVGTKTGTFGVPGVREHCYMLKVCVFFLVVVVLLLLFSRLSDASLLLHAEHGMCFVCGCRNDFFWPNR